MPHDAPAPQQVLCYHDAQLYASDVALFAPRQWLNDSAIHFYLTYLQHMVCQTRSSGAEAAEADGESGGDVLLADPAVVSCLTLQCDDDDEFRELGDGLRLADKRLCLLPVSDNEWLGGASSHWSLLVFRRDALAFEHYDSSAGANARAAARVKCAFEKMLRLCDPSVGAAVTAEMPLEEARDAPQQTNGYDCGVYVLAVAEWLCRQHVGENALPPLAEFVTPERVTQTRRAMPALVRRLQVEQSA
ncbi:hypothetical protein PybrP1_008985 [[Pythium] brassicae (nom. inval.)]|nr:hypothetical protein PybrP1_008985 [[Pythium] brassicae (nom. inval.)]